jgi:MoaA/NifB/PqqE/SkfB family radical SAM enzyme
MDKLHAFRVPALILSGGEPLLRPDLFTIARQAKARGFFTALSSNGTLIDEAMAERIAEVGFDYVGISLDGLEETHDRFRRKAGAFAAALAALRLCRAAGLKVGVRFTLTRDNGYDLPRLLHLVEDEGIDRFYFSHLNYAGRGNKNRRDDAHHALTRWAMDLLFKTCWDYRQRGIKKEFTTGNNDAEVRISCSGHGSITPSGWNTCARDSSNGAAMPVVSRSPISTTWATSTPIRCGGITPSATCVSVPSRRFGRTPLGPADGGSEAHPAPGQGPLRPLRTPCAVWR